MKILQRIKNLWELSGAQEFEITVEPKKSEFYEEDKLEGVEIKEVFIPRVTRDPVKEITEENNDN